MHYIKAIGTLSGYSSTASVVFKVNVTNLCSSPPVTKPPLSDQTYFIFDPEQTIDFDAWTQPIDFCGEFTYTAEFRDNSPLDVLFINFYYEDRQFVVQTDDLS